MPLKNVKFSILYFCIFVYSINLKSQITHRCLSVKLHSGLSFSRTDFMNMNDPAMFNKPNISISPAVTYSFLLPRKDILEIGLIHHALGNILTYSGDQFNTKGYLKLKTYTPIFTLLFHKRISSNDRFYLSLGSLIKYNSDGRIYYSKDDFLTFDVNYKKGLKVCLSGGLKYYFQIKRRTLGLDITYTQGFNTIYDMVVTNNFNNKKNRYVNMGSGLHLGIAYYFGKHHLKDK